MQRRLSDSRSRVVSKIIALAEKAGLSGQDIDIAEFIDRYYRNVAIDDLRGSSPADLAGAALSHLNFAVDRPPGKAKVRVYNPTRKSNGWASTHTIVEIVNDNMPFLVDSAGMAINRLGYSIHLTIHPTFSLTRDNKGALQEIGKSALLKNGDDNESFLRIEIDRSAKEDEFADLEKALLSNLGDVRNAVADWPEMRDMALTIADELDGAVLPLSERVIDEGREMLRWMVDNHFTFLGYREYKLVKGKDSDELHVVPGSGLGILRGEPRDGSVVVLNKDTRHQVRSKDLLLITKANSLATVHRNSYLDYIGIKVFAAGKVVGEKRFLGLFTSTAYSLSPDEIPMLRYKVEQVMQNSGIPEIGHGAKALQHILHTFPRDELFQSSVADLIRTTLGIFHLQERQRIKLFVRRDAFRRFFSCMVFVPRDRYTTQIRLRIEEILMRAFDGKSLKSTVQLSESNLARVHTIVRIKPGSKPKVSIIGIENEIIDAVRSWEDHLQDILVERFGEARGLQLKQMYGKHFPVAYKEDVTPREATFDIERLAALTDESSSLRMSLYRPEFYEKNQLRFKLFHRENPIPISDVLPMLENMGLRVISEQPYHVRLEDDKSIWIQDFQMVYESEALVPAEVNEIFQGSFANSWLGNAENDGFNRLVLAGRLEWREVAVLRAYCRYLLQTGLPFSQKYMEQALYRHVLITKMLAELFRAKLKPGIGSRRRGKEIDRICGGIREALDQVQSQDEDRILTAFLTVIKATLRSNFYQRDELGEPKPYISFKLDPRKIPELPLPRPRFEIFVYSPRMEGVHLRGGMIARGGLRWSDRQEDFRTEILGLMKAQTVKNTLIVPMGAKGGFVCKRLPDGPREEIQREVVACYRTLIRGMLDVTDNLVEGKLVAPRRVVRHDGDDPYLVVAADKGTATFSDIANSIAHDYGFWLGDAFASGGSAGYDHKRMGITARGCWEAVKRHFREIGIDIQNHDFTVVGIGDMAGDVFGNGMLLSRHIRLQGAFNHLHIFLDPDPDPELSFAERKRLFDMPRSSWSDYDKSLLSRGGGIFSRTEKSIPLSNEVKAMLDTDANNMRPQELIQNLLRMRVDLLWNGGIGTYVKAKSESHIDVSDRANDALRVNACDLRCAVIGEGGNLGLTQLGRIEYALGNGRINTDFIDNSAGVDTSDREVNIKILLNLVKRTRPLTTSRRDRLLAAMTDEVAQLVLRNNYLQTQAISMMEANAAERLNEHAHLLLAMERSGELDRELEFLPSDEEISERRKANKGFTRPELSVLLSYSKISLYRQLIDSDVPEDSFLARELHRYFPKPLQKHYAEIMTDHRLEREIIATVVTNSVINRMGPVFFQRAQEDTGADAAAVARSYTIAREIFDTRKIWEKIEALDNAVHANVQYSMMFQISRLLRHATHWLLAHHRDALDIEALVSRCQPGARILARKLKKLLSGNESKRYRESTRLYENIGVPESIARYMAGINALYSALDISEVANRRNVDVEFAARIYFEIGRGLALDWIRDQIEILHVEGRWQAVARGTLRDNLYQLQATLTEQVIRNHRGNNPVDRVSTWLTRHQAQISHANRTLDDMRMGGNLDFATLSVALQEIRKLSIQS